MLEDYTIASSTCTCGQHFITTLFGWIFGYIAVLLAFGSFATAFMMAIGISFSSLAIEVEEPIDIKCYDFICLFFSIFPFSFLFCSNLNLSDHVSILLVSLLLSFIPWMLRIYRLVRDMRNNSTADYSEV